MDLLSKPPLLKRLPQTLLISLAFSVLATHAESPESATPVETERAARTPGTSNATIAAQTTASAESKTPIEKPDGWQLFTSPAGDFHILLPANVHRRADNKPGKSSVQYYQHADDVDFLVADGSYIPPDRTVDAQQGFYEEAVNTIDQQLNKKNQSLVTREVSPVTGKGWHGKQISFRTNDKDLATVRIVFSTADDVGYKLLANTGLNNKNAKTFFDSFEVDPAIASKAHLGSTSSATLRNFVGFVWPVSLIIVAALAVTFVVSAFRNRNG